MGRNKRAKTGGEGSHLFQKERLEVDERAKVEAEERDDEFIPLDKRSLKTSIDKDLYLSEDEDEEIFNLAQDNEESLSSSGEESSDESNSDVS